MVRIGKRLLILSAIFWVIAFFLSAGAFAQSSYVGSAKCESCHKEIYETWKDTLHNKSQQELSSSNDTVVVDWKGVVKLPAWKGQEVTIKLNKTPEGRYFATLICSRDPSVEKTYEVVRTYGGWGWKQRYHVKVGNNHYILPNQWNQETSRWVPYNLQNWYDEECGIKDPSPANSFEAKCAGCHNTGLELKKANGGFESKYVELNTGCEKCHGPGSAHVGAPGKGNIINPRKMPFERALDVCGQCHSRGTSVPKGLHDFPWNETENKPYKIGEPLTNYYTLKPGKWSDSEGHARNHHQQWIDFLRSKHFTGKVQCFDCHSAHGGPSRFQLVKAAHNNTLCLSCHGKDKRFSSPGAIRMHTKHNYAPETTGTGRCNSCHMVKTAASAEAGDIHTHDFKVIKPSVSLEMFKKDPKAPVIPNSCNPCHKDWSKNEAGFEAGVKAYESLFKK
jgi:predicted CXXCH cytochrome family protein